MTTDETAEQVLVDVSQEQRVRGTDAKTLLSIASPAQHTIKLAAECLRRHGVK